MASLTYEEKKKSRDMLPPFMSALGMSVSIQAVTKRLGMPYSALHRWTGGQAHLPTKYHERVEAFIKLTKDEIK